MASTDEKCLAQGAGDESNPPAAGPHVERRHRALELLSQQSVQLDRFETELAEQLQRLADEVAQSAGRSAESAGPEAESEALAALQSQHDNLKREFAALDAQRAEVAQLLDEARLQLSRLEQELRVRDTLLKETQGNEESRRVEFAAARERLADLEAQLDAAHQRQAALERELEQLRDQITTDREETKAQRRRIAREFKQQRAERLAEFDRRKAELEVLAAANNAQAAVAPSDPVDDGQLAALRQALADRTAEIEQLRAELVDEQNRLAEQAPNSVPQVDPQVVIDLERQRSDLTARLEAAETRLSEQAALHKQIPQSKSDIQRRFEMAVEEVRDLKRANAELEAKLKSRPGTSAPASGSGGGLDWEAQKQRLLASLEADNDDNPEAKAEHLSIESTIRITDEIVAQKDQEIADLKLQLEQQSGSATASAHAASELLDRDETIRQERERLVQAQAEWREKIGKAEIDVSVERAKLARERAEIEDKLRQFQSDQERVSNEPAGDGTKPGRGRWLARLGLKEMDEGK